MNEIWREPEQTEQNRRMENGHSNEVENSDSSVTHSKSKHHKFELTSTLREQLRDLPEIIQFIEKLQYYLERQKKKIQKLKKRKHKEKLHLKDASVQTEPLDCKPKSIAEEITEAAEQALQKTGFVYEETSGMYYDYNSGYYYNAEYGLYYDGNSGTYLKYNQETKEYEFHSQVSLPTAKDKAKPPRSIEKRKAPQHPDKKHATKREKRRHSEDEDDGDLEEGECSDCSLHEDTCVTDDENSSDIDYAKQWPPCMRIIVEDSNVTGIKRGSLHVITCEGGTIGREGDRSIVIPDINVSKLHLGFTFNRELDKYMVCDLGSRNGTYLNGERMTPSKMEGACVEIPHGSRLLVGGTSLLCHIHKGNQTCGHCEPGLLQIKNDEKGESKTTNKSLDHKQQLKQLRKKFGIKQGDQGKTNLGNGYTDRAQVRRETVGSQNPHEKTKTASLNESIDSSNKGFKLLSKMGWKEGQSLGKDNTGIVEPVEIVSNPGLSGVGNTNIVNVEVPVDKNKNQLWRKMNKRFKQIPDDVRDIFEDT